MTPAELAAIRARAEAATPGPWICHFGRPDGDDGCCRCRSILAEPYQGAIGEIFVDNGKSISEGGNDCPPEAEARANARFIIHARSDMPALLDEVERLRKALGDVLPLAKHSAGLGDHPSPDWDAYNAARDILADGHQNAKDAAISTNATETEAGAGTDAERARNAKGGPP